MTWQQWDTVVYGSCEVTCTIEGLDVLMLMMLLFFRRQIYIIKLNEYVWVVFAKCAILSDLEVLVPTPPSFKHSRSSSGHAKKNCKLNQSCIPHRYRFSAPPFSQTQPNTRTFSSSTWKGTASRIHIAWSGLPLTPGPCATSWLGHVCSRFVSNLPRYFVSWYTYTTLHTCYEVEVVLNSQHRGARTNMCSQITSQVIPLINNSSTCHECQRNKLPPRQANHLRLRVQLSEAFTPCTRSGTMLPTLLLMEQVNGKIQVSQLTGISGLRDTPITQRSDIEWPIH